MEEAYILERVSITILKRKYANLSMFKKGFGAYKFSGYEQPI